MSDTYAHNPAPITFADITEGMAAMRALPRVEPDITVARNVYDALLAGLPVTVDGSPMHALNVYVDERLPEGAWYKGKPMP